MNNGDLMNLLVKRAKEYAPQAQESIKRNQHMHALTEDETPYREQTDAVIVDFINFIGMKQCMDLGLYTKDL